MPYLLLFLAAIPALQCAWEGVSLPASEGELI